jgi:hypothetical protein
VYFNKLSEHSVHYAQCVASTSPNVNARYRRVYIPCHCYDLQLLNDCNTMRRGSSIDDSARARYCNITSRIRVKTSETKPITCDALAQSRYIDYTTHAKIRKTRLRRQCTRVQALYNVRTCTCARKPRWHRHTLASACARVSALR